MKIPSITCTYSWYSCTTTVCNSGGLIFSDVLMMYYESCLASLDLWEATQNISQRSRTFVETPLCIDILQGLRIVVPCTQNPNHDGRYHAVQQRVDSASYGLTFGVTVVPLQSASNNHFDVGRLWATCRPTKTWPGCRSSFGACIQASAPERLPDTSRPPHRYSPPPLPHPLNVRRRFRRPYLYQ